MLNLPPLTELRSFEAAARHLSFKAAATELGVTPTAISHQIRLLEQHCGQPLFRRRPRPMTLTAAGERLFPVIRDGLEKFAIAFSSVRGDKRGPLRVTATNAFAGRWLVPRLPAWRKAHPGIALEVIGTDAVLDLSAGAADLAIRYARTPPPNLVAQQLFRDRFFAVCHPALLSEDRPIRTSADLRKYPLIDCFWSPSDSEAPTWGRWETRARLAFRKGFEIGASGSELPGGIARHRSRNCRTGNCLMQRYPGGQRTQERQTDQGVRCRAARFRLLHRLQVRAPSSSGNQRFRVVGALG